jgi:hypothetical protein
MGETDDELTRQYGYLEHEVLEGRKKRRGKEKEIQTRLGGSGVSGIRVAEGSEGRAGSSARAKRQPRAASSHNTPTASISRDKTDQMRLMPRTGQLLLVAICFKH